MALSNGPNLGLLVGGLQGEVHYLQLMQQWRGIDGLVQPVVKSATTTAQPASPADGAMYILPASPTGANWSGQGNKIARWSTVAAVWEFYTGKKGWLCNVEDTNSQYKHDGSSFKYFDGYGATASRPSTLIHTGATFLDTTTKKPNWYTGSAWVDATGTTV